MDFKTNQTFFLLLGSTILVSDLFGRGEGAISTKQSNSSLTKIIQCRTKKDWL
jgi:hypothetical protein